MSSSTSEEFQATLNRKVKDLISGEGSSQSHQLTKTMLTKFPDLINEVAPQYRQVLNDLLARERKT
jgi:hypothetical protein